MKLSSKDSAARDVHLEAGSSIVGNQHSSIEFNGLPPMRSIYYSGVISVSSRRSSDSTFTIWRKLTGLILPSTILLLCSMRLACTWCHTLLGSNSQYFSGDAQHLTESSCK